MTQTTLSFLVSPSLLWWVGICAALVAGLWAYHRLAAPLSGLQRTVLRVLRVTALLLILLVLLQPLITRSGDQAGRPRLSVLIDRSSSMKLPAQMTAWPGIPGSASAERASSAAGTPRSPAATRRDQAAAILRRVEAELGETFLIDVHGFAGGLEARQPGEGTYPWEPLGVTAMGEALEEVLLHQAESPAGAVLLVTDGAHTAGKDPALVARNLSVPVFAALVGDTLAPPDLLLRQVRAPGIGYVSEPLAVRVVVEHSDLAGLLDIGAGDEVTVRIREVEDLGGRLEPWGPVLAETAVSLEKDAGVEREMILEVLPIRPGLTLYEVTVSCGERELVTLNNRRLFAAEIREKKTRILYLEGEPDWDFSFLKRTLDADTTLAYSYLVQQPDGTYLAYGSPGPGEPPRTAAQWDAFAAVIIGRLTPASLPEGFVAGLESYMAGGGGALWLGGGRDGDLERWRQRLGGLLPVAVQADRRWGSTLSSTDVSVAGLTHALTSLGESGGGLDDPWRRLPPVWIPEGQYSVSPAAMTLLTGRTAHPAREVPLFALARTAAGRVAVFTGRGFWRWDFSMRAVDESVPLAPEFWRRVMRWLAEPTDRDRFAVRPNRHVFQDSEPPSFQARLFDERYQPVAGAGIRVRIEHLANLPAYQPSDSLYRAADPQEAPAPERRRVEIPLYPDGPAGQYAGQAPPLAPGLYRYQATARSEGSALVQTSEGRFWVEEMGAEFFDLTAQHSLPVLLAASSGGEAGGEGQLESVLRALPERYKKVRVVQQAEIWNHGALFGVIVLLLAGEWILRRRKGLA
jgi:hypothetical protein